MSIFTRSNSSSGVLQQQVTSRYHDHLLTWNNRDDTPRICNGCRELCFKGRYECTYHRIKCDFYLHKECTSPKASIPDATTSLAPNIYRFFPPRSIFEFHEYLQSPKAYIPDANTSHFSSIRSFSRSISKFWDQSLTHSNACCAACGRKAKGFIYYCGNNNSRLYLHPCCTVLPLSLRSDSQNLSLRAELSSSSIRCYSCGEEKYRGRKSWWYVSNCASNHAHYPTCRVERHFHVACLNQIRQDYWNRSASREGDMKVTSNEAELQVAVRRPNNGSKKLDKYLKLLKLVLNIIMTLTGVNPTGLVTDIIGELSGN